MAPFSAVRPVQNAKYRSLNSRLGIVMNMNVYYIYLGDKYFIVYSLKLYYICIFLIGVGKTLATGSIETENFPEKSNEGLKHVLTNKNQFL